MADGLVGVDGFGSQVLNSLKCLPIIEELLAKIT
jgi:hypothetical protein